MKVSKISNINKIREHKNDGKIYGVYSLDFNGEQKVFIRNGDSVGVVTHLLEKSANECVSLIREDVKKEFLEKINQDIYL